MNVVSTIYYVFMQWPSIRYMCTDSVIGHGGMGYEYDEQTQASLRVKQIQPDQTRSKPTGFDHVCPGTVLWQWAPPVLLSADHHSPNQPGGVLEGNKKTKKQEIA